MDDPLFIIAVKSQAKFSKKLVYNPYFLAKYLHNIKIYELTAFVVAA